MTQGNSQILEETISLRPSRVEINLDNLKSNFTLIKSKIGKSKIMPVVKANAYGHGLIPCAQCFENIGADALAVAYLEEGICLRKAGIKIPILVLSGINNSQIPYFLEHGIDLFASSISKLEAIEECAGKLKKKARVHLEIDTGMERTGVHYYSASLLLEAALKVKQVEVVGIASHFAKQGSKDLSYTKIQLERFLEVCSFFEKRSIQCPTRHIAATGAILKFPESHLDMVRPGICLYGAWDLSLQDFKKEADLKAVMKVVSKVVYFKVVKKNAGVSYDHNWTAEEDTRVATVAIGYGDGFLRALSNKAQVIIRGKKYPVIGNINMDQLMVNLGSQGEAYNNDEVVLIGDQGDEAITIEQLASLANTDPRELMVLLNNRLPRVYVGGEF